MNTNKNADWHRLGMLNLKSFCCKCLFVKYMHLRMEVDGRSEMILKGQKWKLTCKAMSQFSNFEK